ncbi:MAG: 4Fe-4S binding protein [Candidatus Heimdallarchaeota archaeon]|nr:MAG: 4Fe-4S binding protein [Candidatus Heimdallarchaeota archaeon]
MVNFRYIPNLLITRPLAYIFRHFLKRPITIPDGDRRNKDTIYFPEELAKKGETILDRDFSFSNVFKHTPHISPNYRGLLALNLMNCTGCKACFRACPNKCIEMVLLDPQPPHWTKKRPLESPQMFIGRCMYCGLCVDACKFDALFHSAGFDGASSRKEDLFYNYLDLYDVFKLYFPKEHETQQKEYVETHGKSLEEFLTHETKDTDD